MIKLPLNIDQTVYSLHDVGKVPPVTQRLVNTKDAGNVGLLVIQLDTQEQVDAVHEALKAAQS